MIDAVLIQQCADPSLKPAIVERFIAVAGSTDPLAITVRSGDRVVLIPKPTTPDEAMALVREHLGKAVVRVGITQYPAGLGAKEVSELQLDLVDACENIRIGTALFGKVYRIVTAWYRAEPDEAFEDAILAWQSGHFEGKAVFTEPDPGEGMSADPVERQPEAEAETPVAATEPDTDDGHAADPNKAGIRIDLSGIGRRAP